MRIAINEGNKAITLNHGGPFGACIVKNDLVIARAHNQVVKNKDCTCHGEMLAIKKACKKLNSFNLLGCTLYTTGEPCSMCLSACLWANIDKIYYGCTLKDNENIGFRDEKIDKVLGGRKKLKNFLINMDRKPCLALFNKYKNLSNKTKY